MKAIWMGGLAVVLGTAFGLALAQSPDHGHPGAPHAGVHYDTQYSHNHYYPARGGYVRVLPHGPVVVTRPGGNYYYSGGAWYRPYGPRFVVVAAPIGVFVPVLPPYYTTLWVGGVPYYYANETYYTSAGADGYQVVDAPPGEPQLADPQQPAGAARFAAGAG